MACRPRCPRGRTSRATGRFPTRRCAGSAAGRSASTSTCPFCATRCGYCDFNTYTASELGAEAPRPPTRRRLPRRCAWPGACSATPTCPLPPSSSGAARRPCCPPTTSRPCCAPCATSSVSSRGGGHDRGQPGQRGRAVAGAAARGRVHPGVLRHAVGRAPRPARPSTARTTRTGCPSRRVGARRGLRGRQPRPDLRHAGGVARRLAQEPRVRAVVRARPRQRLRAGRGGGAPGSPRRCAAARCRLPTTTSSPTATCSRDEVLGAAGLGLVRGQQLGPRRRPARPAQRGLLARPRLVGGRPRCPQPRGRHAVVERAATRRRTRDASPTRASPAYAREVLTPEQQRGGARAAGHPARPRGTRSPTSAPGRASGAPSTTACSTRGAHANGRAALTLRGRLLADAVVRDLLG